MGFALCVMGGRLWFLGHAYFSYTCTGSALDVMDYGLAKAKELSERTNCSDATYTIYIS